jgi:hypothetical protein
MVEKGTLLLSPPLLTDLWILLNSCFHCRFQGMLSLRYSLIVYKNLFWPSKILQQILTRTISLSKAVIVHPSLEMIACCTSHVSWSGSCPHHDHVVDTHRVSRYLRNHDNTPLEEMIFSDECTFPQYVWLPQSP